jgi:ribosomal protein S26
VELPELVAANQPHGQSRQVECVECGPLEHIDHAARTVRIDAQFEGVPVIVALLQLDIAQQYCVTCCETVPVLGHRARPDHYTRTARAVADLHRTVNIVLV